MLRNYRHNTFVKRNQHDVVQEAIANLRKSKTIKNMEALKAAESLVSFKTSTSAKEIFRKQNEQQIQEEALKMRASAAQAREEAGINPQDVDKRKSDNGGAFYQRALTELWANADRASYETMAAKGFNIFENQKVFPAAMKTSLTAMSEGGRVGPMEIFLLYGFRNEQNVVQHGRLNAHYMSSERGKPPPNFLCSEENDTRAGDLVQWWSDYCESHLPKHGIRVEKAQPTSNSTYIQYKNGIPVLVGLQLEECSLSFVRNVLKEFVCKLWVSWPKDKEHPAIPLSKIHANADDFYDTAKYPFPVSLAEIETLKHLDLLILAEYLLRISAPSCPEPFVFRQKAEIQKRIKLRLEQEDLDCSAGQEIDAVDIPLPVISNIQSASSHPSPPSTGALNIPSAISNAAPPVNANNLPPVLPQAFPSSINDASTETSNETSLESLSNVSLDIAHNTPHGPSVTANALHSPSPVASDALPIRNVPSLSVTTPTVIPPIVAAAPLPVIMNISAPSSISSPMVAAAPSPAIPNVPMSSSISPPIMATAPPPNSMSAPLLTGPSEPARLARKTRTRPRKNQSSASRTDSDSVADVSTTSTDNVSVVRRTSRNRRPSKRTNPDPGPQPAAKKAKQLSKGWCDLVPQTDGRVMMVNDKGVSEGYVIQNADGDPILVDENGKFLKTLPQKYAAML
ncbi:hypothetical protein FB446DRAFT_350815 [Lentinula raphanica]|nr:hypothetical protein FB446DRAFT_350815 [Lentinula raphanica]